MSTLGTKIYDKINPIPNVTLGGTFTLSKYNTALATALKEVFDSGVGPDVGGFTPTAIPFADTDGTLTEAVDDLQFSNRTVRLGSAAATSSNQLINSVTLTQRGTSWNGTSSDNRDWSSRVRPTSASTYVWEAGWNLASPVVIIDSVNNLQFTGSVFQSDLDRKANLGTASIRWNDVYTSGITGLALSLGTVTYVGTGGRLSGDTNLTYDSINKVLLIGSSPTNAIGNYRAVGTSPGFYFEKSGNVQHCYMYIDSSNYATINCLKGGKIQFVGWGSLPLGKHGIIYRANPTVSTSDNVGHLFGWSYTPQAGAIHTRWTQYDYYSTVIAELSYDGAFRTYCKTATTVCRITDALSTQTADLHQWRVGGVTKLAVTASGDLVPAADNTRNVGTDLLRFARIRAVSVVQGDTLFDDKECDICEEEFKPGDVLALHVVAVEKDEVGRPLTRTVPVHLRCHQEA